MNATANVSSVIFLVSLLPAAANAAEHELRDFCSLRRSAELELVVKVRSGSDACTGKRCFAGIYTGVVAESGPAFQVGREVMFTTSSPVQIGETYHLFADRIRETSRVIVFQGAGYEISYQVPKTVKLYVPVDGAILKVADDYYRTVWRGCYGGSECRAASSFGRDILKAEVRIDDSGLKECATGDVHKAP